MGTNTKDTQQVRLNPWMGISVRTYVPLIALVLLLGGLFFLLWYPGIRYFGSTVQVTTTPSRAAVFHEEAFLGTTPLTTFLPEGEYQLTVEKTGFTSQTGEVAISGRRFFSLLFPRKAAVDIRLPLGNEELLLQHTLQEVALSSDLPSNQIFTYRPVLQYGVKTLLEINRIDLATDLLIHSLPHLAGETLYDDFSASEALLLDELTEKNALYNEIVAEFPFFPLVRDQFPLSFSTRSFPEDSYQSIQKWDEAQLSPRRRLSGRVTVLRGIPFRFVKGGSYVPSKNPQEKNLIITEIPDFYLMETETTVAMFSEFLKAHPEWQETDALIEKNLVTEDYLLEIESPSMPMRFVSWHAAEAFTHYLAVQIQRIPGWQGAQVRLPHSWEWGYAARMNNDWDAANILHSSRDEAALHPRLATSARAGAIGLKHMYGNLWEWTHSWYSEHPEVTHNGSASFGVSKEIRGGSWISSTRSLNPYSRGAHFPSWSTPYLGFRVIVIP